MGGFCGLLFWVMCILIGCYEFGWFGWVVLSVVLFGGVFCLDWFGLLVGVVCLFVVYSSDGFCDGLVGLWVLGWLFFELFAVL